MRSIAAIIKLILFVLTIIILAPFQILILLLRIKPLTHTIPFLFHNIVRTIFNIHVQKRGVMLRKGQLMYLSNHISYLDIIVMGAVIPGASFVAKSEVKKWPLFGQLADLQQTFFIDRSPTKARAEIAKLKQYSRHGFHLIIFPEGTSTDGSDVTPFKTGMFGLLFPHESDGNERPPNLDLKLQLITLKVLKIEGQDAAKSQALRDRYAWHGDMTLVPHIWAVAKTWRIDLGMIFHPSINHEGFASRNELAQHCENIVRTSLKEPWLAKQ